MAKGIPKNGINKGWFKKGDKGYWTGKKRPEIRGWLPEEPSKNTRKKISESNKNSIGENAKAWKGGRIYQNGYVMIKTKDKHKGRGRYIFEHRLIVEDFIGRKLEQNENIHHKNGIKDDNRIANLELWSTSQPKGQRVEDKIEWAKELLEKYKNFPWRK